MTQKHIHHRVHSRKTRAFQLIITCSVLIAGIVFGFRIAPKPAALRPLPVPNRIAEVAYSGPLILTQIDQSVLGAQAIDAVDFVNEINIARRQAGAPSLRLSTTLMRAAKMRADVIRKYQNFSHQDPHEGIELGTVLPKLNYHYVYATENIGMGGISAANFVTGFMNSTAHKNNLLDPTLTDTGAAIVDGPYKQYYVNYAVQLFAIPGGREEYLGYKESDRELYESQLASVRANLHPLVWVIGRIRHSPRYTQAYRSKLSRQQQILEAVLVRIQKSEPLQNAEVTLILEYNTLL